MEVWAINSIKKSFNFQLYQIFEAVHKTVLAGKSAQN